MIATLLRPGALEGRAVAADGARATACAAAVAAIVRPGGDGPVDALVFDAAWSTVHAVATAWWPGERAATGGKLVLVAPRADAGERPGAAAAALDDGGDCFSGCRFALR